MLLDLCFLINQFIAPLPETLKEFKSLVNSSLPYICDTKLIANTTPFKEDITDTSLEELLRIILQGKPFDMPDVDSGMRHTQHCARPVVLIDAISGTCLIQTKYFLNRNHGKWKFARLYYEGKHS